MNSSQLIDKAAILVFVANVMALFHSVCVYSMNEDEKSLYSNIQKAKTSIQKAKTSPPSSPSKESVQKIIDQQKTLYEQYKTKLSTLSNENRALMQQEILNVVEWHLKNMMNNLVVAPAHNLAVTALDVYSLLATWGRDWKKQRGYRPAVSYHRLKQTEQALQKEDPYYLLLANRRETMLREAYFTTCSLYLANLGGIISDKAFLAQLPQSDSIKKLATIFIQHAYFISYNYAQYVQHIIPKIIKDTKIAIPSEMKTGFSFRSLTFDPATLFRIMQQWYGTLAVFNNLFSPLLTAIGLQSIDIDKQQKTLQDIVNTIKQEYDKTKTILIDHSTDSQKRMIQLYEAQEKFIK